MRFESENRFAVVSGCAKYSVRVPCVTIGVAVSFYYCSHTMHLYAMVSSDNYRDRLISEWFFIQQMDKLWHEIVMESSSHVHWTRSFRSISPRDPIDFRDERNFYLNSFVNTFLGCLSE